jgi:tetratricopeptide (TPR) repeat protein
MSVNTTPPRPGGRIARAVRRCCRPRRLTLAAVLLAAAALAYGGYHRFAAARSAECLERARAALRAGDPDGALADLGEAIAYHPGSVEARRERARLLHERRRWPEAAADEEAALRAVPDDTELLVLHAEALLGVGKEQDRPEAFDRAVNDATRALDLDPGLALAYHYRARAHLSRQEDDDALADAERAVGRAPGDPRVLVGRGMVRASRGEDGQAVADFDRAIRLDPRHARAYAERGLSRLDLHDPPGALADCDRAVELAPGDASAYTARAHVHAQARRLPEALADMDRAVALNDRDVTNRCLRAFYHLEAHRCPPARADVAAALQVNPDSGLARVTRALCFALNGRKTRALEDLEKGPAAAAGGRLVMLMRPAVYCTLREDAKALQCCAAAAGGRGRIALVLCQLQATCQLLQKDAAGAAAACTRALELDPRDAAAYSTRGVARERAGAAADAAKDFAEAVKLDPRKAHVTRGELYLELGEAQRALPDLDEAIRLDPKDPNTRVGRAQACYKEKRWAEGVEACEQALKLLPGSPLLLALRAAGRHELHEEDKALADVTEALAADPEDVHAYLLRGEVRLVRGDFSGALADARAALDLEASEASAYAILGLAQDGLGRHDEASAGLKRAAEMNSHYKELEQKYQEQERTRRAAAPNFPPSLPGLGKPPGGKPAEPVPLGNALWGLLITLGVIVFVGAVLAGVYSARRGA